MVQQQTIDSQQYHEDDDHDCQHWPPADHVVLKGGVVVWLYEDPDALGDQVEEVDGEDDEDSQELLVVFAPHTVIKILTMVIKVLGTPITPHTVITLQEDITVTNHALLHFMGWLQIRIGLFTDERINGVLEGQVGVVID